MSGEDEMPTNTSEDMETQAEDIQTEEMSGEDEMPSTSNTSDDMEAQAKDIPARKRGKISPFSPYLCCCCCCFFVLWEGFGCVRKDALDIV